MPDTIAAIATATAAAADAVAMAAMVSGIMLPP